MPGRLVREGCPSKLPRIEVDGVHAVSRRKKQRKIENVGQQSSVLI